jgi:hypothetical protein
LAFGRTTWTQLNHPIQSKAPWIREDSLFPLLHWFLSCLQDMKKLDVHVWNAHATERYRVDRK